MSQMLVVCFFIICYFKFSQCSDVAWNSFQEDFVNRNREELIVTKVEAIDKVNLNVSVTKWKSLTIGPVCYSIGLSKNSITLLESRTDKDNRDKLNITTKTIDFDKSPSDIILFYNRNNGANEVVCVVAFHEELFLRWFKIQNFALVPFWTYSVDSRILHINSLNIPNRNLLFLVFKEHNTTVGQLIEFNINSEKPRAIFLTSIDLLEPPSSSTFTIDKESIFLSIAYPKNNTIQIYKLERNSLNFYKKIYSPHVQNIISFQICFKSYLAVDGYDAAIYEFGEDDLIKQDIVNSNLDHIHFWLAVPVQTYRDEVIVLAQRSLDYHTHSSNEVEIIINNGGKFEEHEDIPCVYLGEETSRLTCLAEDVGVIGATYISVENKQAFIVPRPNKNSNIIFLISYEIQSFPDPKEDEITKFLIEKERLQTLLQSQKREYQNLKNYKFKNISELKETKIARTSEADNSEISDKIDEIKLELLGIDEEVNKIVEAENKTNIGTVIISGSAKFIGNVETNSLEVDNIGESPASYLLKDIVNAKFIGNVETNSLEVDNIGESPASYLLKDIVNKDNRIIMPGNKTFTSLEVDDLFFEVANNVKAEDFISTRDSSVILNGNIVFGNNVITNTIDVLGKVNDIDFNTDVITLHDKYQGTLELAEVKVANIFKIKNRSANDKNNNAGEQHVTNELDELFIKENVTATYINSLNLTKFIEELCLINISCYIPGNITIQGTIYTKNISTEYLNDLEFPAKYILQDSESFAIINGTKNFESSLEAIEIRNGGIISDINTTEIVTLSTDQDIYGKLVFEDLVLTEELNVTGNVIGKHVDKFLSNPTLQTTNNIKSNVHFTQFEVEGSIIIENYFNNHNFSNLLTNIVYRDEPNVKISGNKEFPRGLTVEQNLEIDSNSINDVKLDSLVTKDLDQNLDSRVLKGNVLIENLHVAKNYDGKNVTQLDESLVKLTGEQFIASTLIFIDDIDVNILKINKLNDILAEDYLYTSADMEIDLDINFENITAENILVEKDLFGNVIGLDLQDIADNYLSYTANQHVESPISITHSKVDDLKAVRLNGIEPEDLFESNFLEKVKEVLNKGEVQIENLVVNGYLQINNINGKKVNELLPKNPFENNTEIIIEGDIYCNELEIDKLSSCSWEELIKEIIFKNESSLKLHSTKTFTDTFTVENLIETKKINDIRVEDVLTKEGKQTIRGPIIIQADVVFKNLQSNNITNTSVRPILDRLRIEDETYVIQGDIIFERLAHIHNLVVAGTLNQKNVNETLLDLVFLDADTLLEEPISFTGLTTFAANLTISDTINDVNFSKKVSQIVRTDQNAEIKKIVHFDKLIIITDKFIVDEDFNSQSLYGINTNDWLEKAVFVNRGLLTGSYLFENITLANILTTKYINNIDMNKVVYLKSNQVIDYLEFEEIMTVKDIKVGGLVNGYQLHQEFEKTAMRDRNQNITTDVVFQNNILVRKNVYVSTINENDASKIVTTNTDQNLTSVYKFNSQCTIYSDLEVHGLINGINVSEWESALKIFSPEIQEVNSEIHILNNLTFTDNVRIDGTIEGLNLTVVATEVEEMRNYKLKVEGGIIDDYNNICTDIWYLHEKAKKQIYKFKYFEHLQHLSFQNNLQNIFSFDFQNKHYLLVNEENCNSHVFIFNNNKFDVVARNIETGTILQVVPAYDKNVVYLVIRGGIENTCSIKGTNIWEFTAESNNLLPKYKIENQILLQKSVVPNTFYTLNQKEIVEYRVDKNGYKKYRKWAATEENAAFMPRGFQTGLALRTGHKIIRLDTSEPIVEDIFDPDIQVIVGSTNEMSNSYIPGQNIEDLVVARVGVNSARKTLLAYISRTQTTVNGNYDLIKIFEDPFSGDLFQEIRTYRPSSLISVEFEQGETLLIFLENQQVLQIYEYKGIEGFKIKQSAKIAGSKMLLMTLPIEGNLNLVKTLGIMDKNNLKILGSVMIGNKIKEDFECGL